MMKTTAEVTAVPDSEQILTCLRGREPVLVLKLGREQHRDLQQDHKLRQYLKQCQE